MPKIPIHLLDVYKERRKSTKELHSIDAFIRGSALNTPYDFCLSKLFLPI